MLRSGSSTRARLALLFTTMFLAIALVATGLTSYLSARRASSAMIRTRARDVVWAVRRSVHASGLPTDALLEELVNDSREQGLRGLLILEPQGTLSAQGGELGVSTARARTTCLRARPPTFGFTKAEGRVTVAVPLGRGGPGRHGRGRHWARPPQPGACLVVTFEPVEAEALVSRALITLIAGSIAALVLLITAVLSWRLWRESERINAELANDRQLRVLGEMSALLGHELRNPLASLKGHAQLLAEKLSEDHPARARVDTVVSEAKRLERLTSQVLDFARSARLELRPTRPQDLAHAVIATVEGAQVQLAMREPFGTWRLDAGKMEQVLTNILQNAVQASGDEVGFEVAEQKGELIFVIRDRGPGIAPGEESRIFEPFYTRRAQGTGLGLALAKRIIEGHGGRIEALNHPEGGAMFRVLLPAELRIADPKVSS